MSRSILKNAENLKNIPFPQKLKKDGIFLKCDRLKTTLQIELFRDYQR